MSFLQVAGMIAIGAVLDEIARWATTDPIEKKRKKIVSAVAKQQDTRF